MNKTLRYYQKVNEKSIAHENPKQIEIIQGKGDLTYQKRINIFTHLLRALTCQLGLLFLQFTFYIKLVIVKFLRDTKKQIFNINYKKKSFLHI